MEERTRSFATLAVLGLLLVLAAVWGWSAATEPFPERAAPPVCVDREYDRGDKIGRGDVTVSVYNAGTRVGLAGLTMDLLADVGFAEGSEGNAPGNRDVAVAEIWTDRPGNPGVALVASHLGDQAEVVRRRSDAPGVTVVVGDGFRDLVAGRRSVVVDRPTRVCGPPRRR